MSQLNRLVIMSALAGFVAAQSLANGVKILYHEKFSEGYVPGPLHGQKDWTVDTSPFNIGSASIQANEWMIIKAPATGNCDIKVRKQLPITKLSRKYVGALLSGGYYLFTKCEFSLVNSNGGSPCKLNLFGDFGSWRYHDAVAAQYLLDTSFDTILIQAIGNSDPNLLRYAGAKELLILERPASLKLEILQHQFYSPKNVIAQVRSRTTGRVHKLSGLMLPDLGDFPQEALGLIGYGDEPGIVPGEEYDTWFKIEGLLGVRPEGTRVLTGVDTLLFMDSIVYTTYRGDADGDNYIGTDDYLILNSSFDKVFGEQGFDARADFDGNGHVGTDDYLSMNRGWDTEGDPPFEPY